MKIIILILLMSAHAHGAWFTTKPKEKLEKLDTTDRDRRIEVETQLKESNRRLAEQQQLTSRLQVATESLSVGCVVLLVIGTALGARARKDGHEK